MNYTPRVNDYVKWSKDVEGWVYFKCKEYITIEVSIRPKSSEEVGCPLHQNYHILVLCFYDQWKDLVYVKSRQSKNEKESNNVEMVGESIRREGIKM